MLSFLSDTHSVATLHGHQSAVMSLAFSPRGNMLASGGADCLKVWDMRTWKEISIPDMAFYERIKVCCIAWVTAKEEDKDILCYGNAHGYLVFLQYEKAKEQMEILLITRIARGAEILCLATQVNPASSMRRLVTGTRDKCVQLWAFDINTRQLTAIESKSYGEDNDIIPRMVAFDRNDDRDFWVFGLYDGGLYKYSGKDVKTNLAKLQLGSQIGCAAVDLERRMCVIDNVGNGFDLYNLDTGKFIKLFKVGEPTKTFPRGVGFADDSHAVITGSDHGQVYIFNVRDGRVLKGLNHSKGGVETVSVYDQVDGSVLISSASASALRPQAIRIWKWTPDRKKYEGPGRSFSIAYLLMGLFQLLMFCASIAYAIETYKKMARGGKGGLLTYYFSRTSGRTLDGLMGRIEGVVVRFVGKVRFGKWW